MLSTQSQEVEEIIKDYFRGGLRCECNVHHMKHKLVVAAGESAADRLMVELYFQSIFEAAVHSYRKDLLPEFRETLLCHVSIDMHGGGRRVYRPFLDGIDPNFIMKSSQTIITEWKSSFVERFGEKATKGLVANLVQDGDFKHSLKGVLSEDRQADIMSFLLQ